jgi:predicted CoA-substrate-specific enzyme activase
MGSYFVGIDIGSMTTKVTIISDEKKILGRAIVSTGFSASKSAEEALDQAMKLASLKSSAINRMVATGYGRNLISSADEKITEITCHAQGAFERIGSALTLIDIGGQDSKAIAINSSGKVDKFIMNERCAAGTGRFLEVMARALETDLENMSAMALKAPSRSNINSMCTVFAETEVIGLIARGAKRDEIASGLCWSVAERIASMAKKVGINELVFVSGGVAYNEAVISALSVQLGKNVQMITEPQLNGAFGAALIALQKAHIC